MEVHAHVRSARPRVALIFSALLLAGVLVLAQIQVAMETSLQEPVTVPGADITYRPPNGWIASEEVDGAFDLMMKQHRLPLKRLDLEVLPRGKQPPSMRPDSRRSTHLAGLPAIEEEIKPQRGEQPAIYFVRRMAKTARNETLVLTLQSRTELNLGDYDMLDAVAASITLGSEDELIKNEDLLSRIGIQGKVPADWYATAAWHAEIPGGYFYPPPRDNLSWTLELVRTFIAPNDTPEEILTAAALTQWPLPSAELLELKEFEADGKRLYRATTTVPLQHELVDLWLVVAGPREALMALASINDTRLRESAESPLPTLLNSITFTTPYPDDALSDLAHQGQAIVEMLNQRGPAPWWGREMEEMILLDRNAGPQVYIEQHDANHGEPKAGYFGDSIHVIGPGFEHVSWQLEPDSSYTRSIKQYVAGPLRTSQLVRHIEETYDRATETLSRQYIEPAEETQKWPVPDIFIAQPIDILVHYQVALGQSPNCIVALSNANTPNVQACFLRRLEPSPSGQPRVLEQDAYLPQGMIYTFDKDAELFAVESDHFNLKQTSLQTAETLVPALRQLPQLKTIQQSRR